MPKGISSPLVLCLLAGVSFLLLGGCKEQVSDLKPQHDLVAPFDVADIRARAGKNDKRSFTCPDAPNPIVNLYFNSMYDKDSENASIVDPKELAKYKRATKDIQTLESKLNKHANMYVMAKNPRPDIARCVVEWINVWAKDEALLGDSNRMGEFVRKWALSSIALAYLQVRDEPSLSQEERVLAEAWIRRLADRVVADFSKRPDINSRRNNHMYWAGWGVTSAAIVLDDREMLDWGIEAARIGIRQIQEDGTLPLELARGPKAYNYHHYAAIPLMMIAGVAEKNGVHLFEENDRALLRFGQVILRNIEDSSYFEKLTGETQNLDRTITDSNLSWLEPYYAYYKDRDALKWLDQYRPVKHSRVGGNATFLYGPGK